VPIDSVNPRRVKSLRKEMAGGGSFFRSRHAVFMKRLPKVDAPSSMPEQIAGIEDVTLQFARQLYEDCLKRHGADHQQTQLLSDYLSSFEKSRQRQR
jgi:hypothetical protein